MNTDIFRIHKIRADMPQHFLSLHAEHAHIHKKENPPMQLLPPVVTLIEASCQQLLLQFAFIAQIQQMILMRGWHRL